MPTSILLYGRTNAGKSTQMGVLAEHVAISTGKRTRFYTSDPGGYKSIKGHELAGVLDVVEIGTSDPWIFANRAAQGYVKVGGRWLLDKGRNAEIGAYMFDSAHSMARAMKADMEAKAGLGIMIGGDTNASFDVQGDGEKLRIGASKGYSKFAAPQSRIEAEMLASFKLDADYVVWSAGIDRDEDDLTRAGIIGPGIIGKALTTTLPASFNYVFRIDVLPAQAGKPERHIIYLGTHVDVNAGNCAALGNIRRPLDAPELKDLTIEPANIVTALKLVQEDAIKASADAITKRLAAAKITFTQQLIGK